MDLGLKTMFYTTFAKRPLIEEAQAINVSVLMRNNYLDLNRQFKETKGRDLSLLDMEDLELFIRSVKTHSNINLKQEKDGKVEFSKPNSLDITTTPSNLGKGSIFWFVCNLCKRKCRYLYIPLHSELLACRRCHRLTYNNQNEPKSTRSWRSAFN